MHAYHAITVIDMRICMMRGSWRKRGRHGSSARVSRTNRSRQTGAATFASRAGVAEGLAVLGSNEAAVGRAWHLPTAWNGSTRALVERFASAAGRAPKLFRVPTWLLRFAGLFAGEIGAFAEMIYQWETPYALDDSAFRSTFGVGPTPIDVAVAETLESARAARRSAGEGRGWRGRAGTALEAR
jgi:hypothetical protein